MKWSKEELDLWIKNFQIQYYLGFKEIAERYGKDYKKCREEWLKEVERLFKGALGIGAEGFTEYQKRAIEEVFYGDENISTYAFLWSRQVGKTTIMGIISILYVLLHYPSTIQVLVIGPILRYSSNLYQSILRALNSLEMFKDDTETGFTESFIERKTLTTIFFAWGSNIVCLPSKRIRGFSPSMIIIDECAFMPEESWQEILPMLKVMRKGVRTLLVVSSTPFGTMNRFYNIWMTEANGGNVGFPFHVTYKDCPFIDKEKIERELNEGLMSEVEYRMEYLAEFVEEMGAAIPEKLIIKNIKDYPVLEIE